MGYLIKVSDVIEAWKIDYIALWAIYAHWDLSIKPRKL
jgi:hypothetical protein